MTTNGQPFRTKSLTAKVTEDEYARLQELATGAGQSMGEWARTVLLAQVNSSQTIILAEILALRNIMVNLAHAQSDGEKLTVKDIEDLMAEADAIKRQTAIEKLSAGSSKRGSNELPRTE
ncbi:MAG TPA: hypothetical protein VN176_13115 [Verrucomicrobiae bacterium]|nr:hypothetical protein [Verrucomicrobiae bacterium]